MSFLDFYVISVPQTQITNSTFLKINYQKKPNIANMIQIKTNKWKL